MRIGDLICYIEVEAAISSLTAIMHILQYPSVYVRLLKGGNWGARIRGQFQSSIQWAGCNCISYCTCTAILQHGVVDNFTRTFINRHTCISILG